MRKKSSFPEKSRGLFFTLGLVLAMSSAYIALTAEFRTPQFVTTDVIPVDDGTLEIPITAPVLEKPKVREKPKEIPVEPIEPIDPFKPIKIIDDGGEDPDPWETDTFSVIAPVFTEEIDPIPDGLLDRRPVFAGCSMDAEEIERFKCFQEMLYRRISGCITFRNNNAFETYQKIWVQFVIGKDGNVSKVTFPRGGDEYYTKQLEDCVMNMPTFTPGIKDNRYVPTSFTVPVKITLQ
jgi:protein TonB